MNQIIDDLGRPVARGYLECLRERTSADLMAEYLDEPVGVESLRR